MLPKLHHQHLQVLALVLALHLACHKAPPQACLPREVLLQVDLWVCLVCPLLGSPLCDHQVFLPRVWVWPLLACLRPVLLYDHQDFLNRILVCLQQEPLPLLVAAVVVVVLQVCHHP